MASRQRCAEPLHDYAVLAERCKAGASTDKKITRGPLRSLIWRRAQAEEAREKAAAVASDAAALAAQAQALGREARLGRQLRDENFRLEQALAACAAHSLLSLCPFW